MNNIICPFCRSTLKPIGNVDFNAPSISVINCPVCGYPNWIPSGYPIPYRYTALGIVNAVAPTKTWAEFKAEKPEIAANMEKTPTEASQSIYKDFSVTGALETSANAVGKTLGDIAGGVGEGVGKAVGGLFTGLTKNTGGIVLIGIAVLILIYLLKQQK